MSELLPPVTLDGPDIVCDFQTWYCTNHAALAGGFDQHHKWPKSMGGPEHPEDLLVLCPTHHRRQHALIRAYVENGPDVDIVKWFSKLERDTARYAYDQWVAAGRPEANWSSPAAAVNL